MHLLGSRIGWLVQDRLWGMATRGELLLADLGPDGLRRCRELMRRYADVPMDLADATLAALAEEQGFRRIFSLDSDFGIYRLEGGRPLRVLP